MKLKSIKLKNIGLYKDKIIEFPYKDQKNTIIVWGNNGAGKTTLINSVKIGLLGKNAVQMTYPDYCDFIKSKIISTRCNIQNDFASIEIEFELNNNNKKEIYRIVRSWSEESEVFIESDSIYQGDLKLNVEDKDYIKNIINRSLPSSLLDVIVFDGENAINILNEGKMSTLIKDILYSVFNMDIYNALSKDLNSFLRSANSNSDISTDDQLKFIKLETEYKAALKNHKKLENLIEQQNKNKTNKLRELRFSLNRFSEKTGIDVHDIEKLNAHLENAHTHKEKMYSDLKYINEEILPLKLVHKRIKELINTINENKSYAAQKSLINLKEFFLDSEEAELLLEKLELLLPKEGPSINYDFKEYEITTVRNIDSVLSTYTKDTMLKAIDTKNDYLRDIRNKLKIASKTESKESKELLANLENLYNEISEINNILDTLEDEKQTADMHLNNTKAAYSEIKAIITKQKKESSSYVTALKYRESIDEFVKLNIENICYSINNKLTSYLEKMNFRNNSIGRVEISTKSFEINLYEKDGKIIPSYLFSAGEKQVLLGLVIKAALSLSEVDCFFLFDTPVGRLDKKNREIFTKEVIFSVSDQAFIFATDSDYSEDDYHKIQSNISSEFRLKRNEFDEIIATEDSVY